MAQAHWCAWSQRVSNEMLCPHFPQALMICSKWMFLKKAYNIPQLIREKLQPGYPQGSRDQWSNTTFFRKHHPGKAVTPCESQDTFRVLDPGCICAAARKRSCPHFIHTNIHRAVQKAGPVLWADSSLCTNIKDQAGIVSTARSILGLCTMEAREAHGK